jgi:hypothetical protein
VYTSIFNSFNIYKNQPSGAVEYLPRKRRPLSSNPRTTKRKKQKHPKKQNKKKNQNNLLERLV